MRFVTFCIGAGLASLAGALITPLSSVDPNMGVPWLVNAFMLVYVSSSNSFSWGKAPIRKLLEARRLLPIARRLYADVGNENPVSLHFENLKQHGIADCHHAIKIRSQTVGLSKRHPIACAAACLRRSIMQTIMGDSFEPATISAKPGMLSGML